jgi:hypothetical protein
VILEWEWRPESSSCPLGFILWSCDFRSCVFEFSPFFVLATIWFSRSLLNLRRWFFGNRFVSSRIWSVQSLGANTFGLSWILSIFVAAFFCVRPLSDSVRSCPSRGRPYSGADPAVALQASCVLAGAALLLVRGDFAARARCPLSVFHRGPLIVPGCVVVQSRALSGPV